ncbi:phage integrase N-terminal SAM-like domain-containing protein [Acidithiobacillus thiooxidans]|uniref:phage integrase N-terminal SAM-like domain-containing protein n=1 Tax=Acidithiobacillus thiooxidans TaxID=930 RepID=UPI00046637DB|nr:phage integrase N-terminal SAM-like domain-containing protein [Acidithiobacillus thiooxidans]
MKSTQAHPSNSPKLLDQLRARIQTMHYSIRTEEVYTDWVRRFILFHRKRHPQNMGAAEVEAFLSYLANERHVSSSTQNEELSTQAIAEFDAETRFRAMASSGDVTKGLAVLDMLDSAFSL